MSFIWRYKMRCKPPLKIIDMIGKTQDGDVFVPVENTLKLTDVIFVMEALKVAGVF